MTKLRGTIQCDLTSAPLRNGVPRHQFSIMLERLAKLLRENSEGDILAHYDYDNESWSYELVQISTRSTQL
jgi:hypothetical protein